MIKLRVSKQKGVVYSITCSGMIWKEQKLPFAFSNQVVIYGLEAAVSGKLPEGGRER